MPGKKHPPSKPPPRRWGGYSRVAGWGGLFFSSLFVVGFFSSCSDEPRQDPAVQIEKKDDSPELNDTNIPLPVEDEAPEGKKAPPGKGG